MLNVVFSLLLAQVAVPAPMPPTVPPGGTQSNEGLIVSGSGSAEVQAGSATLMLRVGTRSNAMSITQAELQPIADALVKAGVDRQSIVLPFYLQGAMKTNNATITGRVDHPTTAMLKSGIDQLASAFGALPDLTLQGVEIRLKADNCEALSRQAQAMALRRARANAEYLAAQLHVHVGAVQSVQAAPMGDPQYGCTSTYTIGPYASTFQFNDAQDFLTVRIFTSVTARYAIRP